MKNEVTDHVTRPSSEAILYSETNPFNWFSTSSSTRRDVCLEEVLTAKTFDPHIARAVTKQPGGCARVMPTKRFSTSFRRKRKQGRAERVVDLSTFTYFLFCIHDKRLSSISYYLRPSCSIGITTYVFCSYFTSCATISLQNEECRLFFCRTNYLSESVTLLSHATKIASLWCRMACAAFWTWTPQSPIFGHTDQHASFKQKSSCAFTISEIMPI